MKDAYDVWMPHQFMRSYSIIDQLLPDLSFELSDNLRYVFKNLEFLGGIQSLSWYDKVSTRSKMVRKMSAGGSMSGI